MLFKCQACDRLERQLQAERVRANDLADRLLSQDKAFSLERAQLLDKIMALSRPEALREYRRALFSSLPGSELPAPRRPVTEDEAPRRVGPVRPNFPGYSVNRRPPSPSPINSADVAEAIGKAAIGKAP